MADERALDIVVDRKAPRSAARLALVVAAAWVLPGVGHALLGRLGRGLLFGGIVWTCFGLGLAHDGRLALRDPRQPVLSALQIVANIGVGPADVAARLAIYGAPAYAFRGFPDWRSPDAVERTFRNRASSGVSIYGTAYLWTAGLMNLLLLFDVWDIGLGRKT